MYKYSLERDVLIVNTGHGQYKFRIENADLLDNVDSIAGIVINELQGIDEKQGSLRDDLSHYAKLLLATLNISERHAKLEKKVEQLSQTIESLQVEMSQLGDSQSLVESKQFGVELETRSSSAPEVHPNQAARADNTGPQQDAASIVASSNLPAEKGAPSSTHSVGKEQGEWPAASDSSAISGSKKIAESKSGSRVTAHSAPSPPASVRQTVTTVDSEQVKSRSRMTFEPEPDSTAHAKPTVEPVADRSGDSSVPADSMAGKGTPARVESVDSNSPAHGGKQKQALLRKKDTAEPFQSINPSAQYLLGSSVGSSVDGGSVDHLPAPVTDTPSSVTVPGGTVTGRPMFSGLRTDKSLLNDKSTVSVPLADTAPSASIDSPASALSEESLKRTLTGKTARQEQEKGAPLSPPFEKKEVNEKPISSNPVSSPSKPHVSDASPADRSVSIPPSVTVSPAISDDTISSPVPVADDGQVELDQAKSLMISPDRKDLPTERSIAPPVAVRSSAKSSGPKKIQADVRVEKTKAVEAHSSLSQPPVGDNLSNNEKAALTGKSVVSKTVTPEPVESSLYSPPSARKVASSSSEVELPVSAAASVAAPSYTINTPHQASQIRPQADGAAPALGNYTLPLLSFLNNSSSEGEIDRRRIRSDAELLEKKLGYFGIKGEVMGISPGPVITTYEYKPDPGIKISKIVNLADDLALALSAYSIRIVAPIPGKDVMGIEIPNIKKSLVPFIDIVTSNAFKQSKSKIPICLGKDIIGNPVVVELESMPHLLIAGATGTGKSVGLNAMITSILYKASPDEVKFLMVDPKRIELSFYNDIPHLLTPVITDMNKANIALQWMVREMDRRYNLLAHFQVRHIEQFNQKLASAESPQYSENGEQLESLPYIVVIIDELADLMMTASRDIEFSLTRLAQMARAAGIHLILATQRPSVDVLTGIIKANFPTRISFQVSSKTDSRTIIDSNGAETLLGNGDMLFVPPGTARLTRVHGTYLSEDELFEITTFIKKQRKPEYIFDVITEQEPDEVDSCAIDDEYDEKYNEALEVVLATRQASISGIQRALRVGYNRAARIIDLMEKKGVVGPSDGVKPRKVLGNGVNMM